MGKRCPVAHSAADVTWEEPVRSLTEERGLRKRTPGSVPAHRRALPETGTPRTWPRRAPTQCIFRERRRAGRAPRGYCFLYVLFRRRTHRNRNREANTTTTATPRTVQPKRDTSNLQVPRGEMGIQNGFLPTQSTETIAYHLNTGVSAKLARSDCQTDYR